MIKQLNRYVIIETALSIHNFNTQLYVLANYVIVCLYHIDIYFKTCWAISGTRRDNSSIALIWNVVGYVELIEKIANLTWIINHNLIYNVCSTIRTYFPNFYRFRGWEETTVLSTNRRVILFFFDFFSAITSLFRDSYETIC